MSVALLISGCRADEVTTTGTLGYKDIQADQIIIGMEQYVTNAGRLSAVLRGDTAFIFDDSAMAHVKNVHLTLYDEAGHESARLTSDDGDFSTRTNAMVARGGVVLITSGDQASTIETEELHFDPNAKRIWSTKPTTRRMAGGGIVRGTGFEADSDIENVRVTNASSAGGGMRIQF